MLRTLLASLLVLAISPVVLADDDNDVDYEETETVEEPMDYSDTSDPDDTYEEEEVSEPVAKAVDKAKPKSQSKKKKSTY